MRALRIVNILMSVMLALRMAGVISSPELGTPFVVKVAPIVMAFCIGIVVASFDFDGSSLLARRVLVVLSGLLAVIGLADSISYFYSWYTVGTPLHDATIGAWLRGALGITYLVLFFVNCRVLGVGAATEKAAPSA
jgi:hypothetical protein